MDATWTSLLPPAAVIITAFATHRVNPSLTLGILCACLIGAQFSPWGAFTLLTSQLITQLTSPDALLLYAFLLTIGILIKLLDQTQAAPAFAQHVGQYLKTARSAERFSMFLSLLLALDDYLSILTTGHIMQPIADRLRVSRLKLAFLIHSMATPIVILVPFSSWIAILISSVSNPALASNGFTTYLMTLPFIFYSTMAIFSVVVIVNGSLSFGPMRTYEQQETQTPTREQPIETTGSPFGLIIPLIVLIGSILIGTLFAGGYSIIGSGTGFFEALRQGNSPFLIMFLASLAACITSCIIGMCNRSVSPTMLPRLMLSGVHVMFSAVLMVFLASILSTLLTETVNTGDYLASILLGSVNPYTLPPILFATALLVTLATGSSWGTFALLPPMVIPMTIRLLGATPPVTLEEIPLLLPALGALFSGAICGDHVSPFSETTIMAAISSQTKPIEHARTQFIYMLPAMAGTFIAFYVAGRTAHYGLTWTLTGSLVVGLCVTGILLFLCNRMIKE